MVTWWRDALVAGQPGKEERLEAVIWAAMEAKSILADPIDLRRTVEGELGARTDGDRDEPDLGRIAPTLRRGRQREEKGRWSVPCQGGASGGDGCGGGALVGPIYRPARSVHRGNIFGMWCLCRTTAARCRRRMRRG
jgi:hypothetical protein